jgi:hypothetical protein
VPFRLNRAYAERFGDAWVILSAKYGFIPPDFVLPGPYEVTFKRRSTQPISFADLQRQVEELALDQYDVVIGLGGKEYRAAIESALTTSSVQVNIPFAGLTQGKLLQATKQSIGRGDAGFIVSEFP